MRKGKQRGYFREDKTPDELYSAMTVFAAEKPTYLLSIAKPV